MKKLFSLLAVVAALGLVGAGSVYACEKNKNCKCQKQATAQKAGAAKAPMAFDKAPAVGTKATCPVSGKEFVVTADTKGSEYKGKHYVFCCPGCKPKFDANPEKYIKK